MKSKAVRLVVLLLSILVATVILSMYTSRAPLAFGTVAVGVITFFYFALSDRSSATDGGERFRNAIASAIVIQYLVMVGFTGYFVTTEQKAQLDPITSSLITSFTSIVGIVIAFYFGSSAYVEGQRRRSTARAAEAQNAQTQATMHQRELSESPLPAP